MSTANTCLAPPQAPPTWTHTPSSIQAQTQILIDQMRQLDDQIGSIALDQASLANVVEPIAHMENIHAGQINQLGFYQHVSPNKELRDASLECDSQIRKFGIESGLREDVFKVIKKVYLDHKDDNSLDGETKRFLEKIYLQYKRNGLDLSSEVREQVKSIKEELSQLSIQYSSNLSEDNSFIEFTEEELKGVPQDVINSFEKDETSGKYKMTFKYPHILPVMKYAQNENTRKVAFTGDQNKIPENADILKRAVLLRYKLAKLMGYKNFSQFTLEERMAKNEKNVLAFLLDLKSKLIPLGEKEIARLKQMKGDGEDFYIWDQRYFSTKMLEDEYNVDDLKISEFFPIKKTIEGMFKIYEEIFQLKFVHMDNQAWHEDVTMYQVWKTDVEEFVGYLYLDLHPRPGKYGHAANFGLFPGYTNLDGERTYPVTSLVCNFTPDSQDKPSLLKHNEVVTFFHELGHGIHDLMGKTKYSRFHGTSVAWDFVEMPSQLLEYFCWDKNVLKELSNHYESGEKLPEELIDSIIKSKHVNGALFNLRQLHFGLFDMSLHTNEGQELDVDSLWNDMREEICLVSNGGETFKGYGSFGHMMGGYQSGYYGYLWSQVFASDVFYTKFMEDPMNVQNGVNYRDMVISKGGSEEESTILKNYLGREPSNDAFLKELGLN